MHCSNQIFHYTHCITPKRVTSLQGPLRLCPLRVMATQLPSKKCRNSGQRFEPQTSRSRDERVTAPPTTRYTWTCNVKIRNVKLAAYSIQFVFLCQEKTMCFNFIGLIVECTLQDPGSPLVFPCRTELHL